jgi:hypothetical protein
MSRLVFGHVIAQHALITLQRPLVIGTLGEPIGNTDLGVYGAPTHGNAGHLAVGNDLLEAKLRVAEHGDESNEHGNLSGYGNTRLGPAMQGSCHIDSVQFVQVAK